MLALTSPERVRARATPTHKIRAGYSVALLAVVLLASMAMAQSGHRPVTSSSGGVSVNVIATRDDDRPAPITGKEVAVFENGVEQAIKNFSLDPSPARIVLLVA